MSTTTEYSDVMVCTDCYFAHHYGWHSHDISLTPEQVGEWLDSYRREGGEVHETSEGVIVRQWFAGESDTPADREPLNLLNGYELSDNTCSNHNGTDDVACSECDHEGYEDGIHDFSMRSCQGCGSTLGGSRYRMAVWS